MADGRFLVATNTERNDSGIARYDMALYHDDRLEVIEEGLEDVPFDHTSATWLMDR